MLYKKFIISVALTTTFAFCLSSSCFADEADSFAKDFAKDFAKSENNPAHDSVSHPAGAVSKYVIDNAQNTLKQETSSTTDQSDSTDQSGSSGN